MFLYLLVRVGEGIRGLTSLTVLVTSLLLPISDFHHFLSQGNFHCGLLMEAFSSFFKITVFLMYNSHTQETHPFKVYSSVIFGILVELYSYHHCQILCWEKKPLQQSLSIPHHSHQQLIYFLSLQICLFWIFCINGITHVYFCDCLLSLNMFSRFFYVVAYIRILFLFIAKFYFIQIVFYA